MASSVSCWRNMPRSNARIRFLKEGDASEWVAVDTRLETLVDVVRFLVNVSVVEVTSFHRPQDTGSPHGYHRAVDLRTRDWPAGEALAVAVWINSRYQYSTLDRKVGLWVCLFGQYDVLGGHDDHMHLQVPPVGESVVLRSRVGGELNGS